MGKSIVLGLCFSVLIGGTLLAVTGSTAWANNHADTWFSVSSSGHGFTATDAREKTDDSSGWLSCYGADGLHLAQLAGRWTPNGETSFYGPRVPWNAGQSGYLTNYVKEHGQGWAVVWLDGTPHMKAWGIWSPDSI